MLGRIVHAKQPTHNFGCPSVKRQNNFRLPSGLALDLITHVSMPLQNALNSEKSVYAADMNERILIKSHN
jgi:hypothetical protein